jgi:hypothetical protein
LGRDERDARLDRESGNVTRRDLRLDVLVDAVVPEPARLDAVVRGRLVEPHERIRVEPVAARPVTPVDQHDLGLGVRQERVGECHSRRTGSHDQVVGLDLPDRQGFAFIVTGASALLLAAVNHKEAQMPGVVARDFDSPDETRTPDKTKVVGVHQQ